MAKLTVRRWCWIAVLLAVTAVQQATAQSRLLARASYLPLYDGDATVGPISKVAGTLDASILIGSNRRAFLQTFYIYGPRDRNPYNRAPRIQLGGILLGVWGGPMTAWSPLLSVGAGLIDVRADSIGRCEFP